MEYVLRYDGLPGKNEELVRWVKENTDALNQHAAEGWTYLGTWFTVRSFGEYTAETRWALDGYAALGSGFGNEENIRLLQEWLSLVDQTRPWQASLLKSATEVDVLAGS